MMRRLGAIGWLLVLSFMATVVYSVHPEVRVYGMHSGFYTTGQWRDVVLQFLLFQFFHGGVLHLFSNAFFLVFVGVGVQYAMGWKRFLGMFLFTTLFVGAILMFTSRVPTIGMSGFAMSVLAYYTMMLYFQKNPQYKSGLVLIGINIFIGLDPAISLGGHLWGTVAGVLFFFFDHMLFRHSHRKTMY